MKDKHSLNDFTNYKKDDLEVRVDFVRPETQVEYRINNEPWESSFFQSADVNHLTIEQVWEKINDWLD